MAENRVRIIDIAEELGLSTATVSNVIHGKTKKISDATVKRVQELLEKRQYIPSRAGILLAQNNSKIIGVVINDHKKYEGHVLEDGFIAASINSLSLEINKAGYFMMIKTTTEWNEIAKFASMWNMVGLVLMGFCEQDYQKLRDNMHIPFVIYEGFIKDGKGLVNLVINNFDGGRQMGEHLKSLGHEKVLCIADNDICMDLQRFKGLKSVIPLAELLVVPMNNEERESFYNSQMEYLFQFTAVFAVSDYYAVDFLHFLYSKKINVPEKISVAGFDDSLLSRQVTPSLTTVGQNHKERAKMAVDLLEKMRRNEEIEGEYYLPLMLIERDSTKNE